MWTRIAIKLYVMKSLVNTIINTAWNVVFNLKIIINLFTQLESQMYYIVSLVYLPATNTLSNVDTFQNCILYW